MLQTDQLIARYTQSFSDEQPLRQHLINTAQKASESLQPLGLDSLGHLLGLVHDIGKATQPWQAAIKAEKARYLANPAGYQRQSLGLPHAPPGAQFLYRLLKEYSASPPARLALQMLCLAVLAHHGYLMDNVSLRGEDRYLRDIGQGDAEGWQDMTAALSALPPLEDLGGQWQHCVKAILPALRRVQQASLHCGNQRAQANDLLYGLMTRHLYAALIDADRLDAARFEAGMVTSAPEPAPPDWSMLLATLMRRIDAFAQDSEIDKLRAQISSRCGLAALWPESLVALHAPTGGGKTLASLRYALARAMHKKRRRIIYVVSYTTILDQVYEEYRKTLQDCGEHVRLLLHHSNIIPDEDQGEKDLDEQQLLLAERWDTDILLTSQVQFFNALYLGTAKAARRMPALSEAVILFDEVQTIPAHLTHLFNAAISYLIGVCDCDVMLSSATQPQLTELTMPLPPVRSVFSAPDELFNAMRRVRLHDMRDMGRLSARELADFAIDKQAAFTSVLVVLNTRRAARRVFEAIKQQELQGVKLYLLSNDLCLAHRKRIIDQLQTAQSQPCICVSTQLIECGVDLSFGCAIRSLAGADNIWQTAGRCNRHGRDDLRPVYIIQSADEELVSLVDIARAGDACVQTLAQCDDPDDLQRPSVMAQYYRHYHHLQQDQLSYPTVQEGIASTLLDMLSSNAVGVTNLHENHSAKPAGMLRQAFRSAGSAFQVVDSAAKAVIAPYEEGEQLILDLNANPDHAKQQWLLRRAQHYSINLYDSILKKLEREQAVFQLPCGAYALHKEWYDPVSLGLLDEPRLDNHGYMV